ncbi:hypothetical protein [Alteromonas sp. A079]|uniref:hypothetical protein n=1 Tax=Alteromonas sp. A079 TaxID=3410268 RepID=UPI003BA0F07B
MLNLLQQQRDGVDAIYTHRLTESVTMDSTLFKGLYDGKLSNTFGSSSVFCIIKTDV